MENHGTSPFLIGKSTLNCWLAKGLFTRAIFPQERSPARRRGEVLALEPWTKETSCMENWPLALAMRKKQLIEAHEISLGTIVLGCYH